MEVEIDHYQVLGLNSTSESPNYTDKEIAKAYRKKALELHPDKHPNDPNAPSRFQKLQISYEILKDPKVRKEFDDLLRIRREKEAKNKQYDAKRRRMVSDLEERERKAEYGGERSERDVDEERIKRKLAKEIAQIREMMAKRGGVGVEVTARRENKGGGGGGGVVLDKGKVLKVSWEKGVSDYDSSRLREMFGEVGEVEDVVIKSNKKKGSALVVMASKEDADAATGILIGDLSNPLLVIPLQPRNSMPSVRAQEPVGGDALPPGNVVGAGFKAFEDSVLEKLRQAAQKQKADKKDT